MYLSLPVITMTSFGTARDGIVICFRTAAGKPDFPGSFGILCLTDATSPGVGGRSYLGRLVPGVDAVLVPGQLRPGWYLGAGSRRGWPGGGGPRLYTTEQTLC